MTTKTGKLLGTPSYLGNIRYVVERAEFACQFGQQRQAIATAECYGGGRRTGHDLPFCLRRMRSARFAVARAPAGVTVTSIGVPSPVVLNL